MKVGNPEFPLTTHLLSFLRVTFNLKIRHFGFCLGFVSRLEIHTFLIEFER